ncbi:PASTA domain-containing protein [Roseitranquillus sediminis]|uniref:PASTA domain-containing protein n=1 Tax=Roseitranquillus sediminis TaxID=2809051 RepID=UPI001D0BFB8F|nr:PASTA domain-containing protein [Roseitranquillus sediminis]MBM9593571.1 PASTA domain-containing protein [Roseitranquillus sediminis]
MKRILITARLFGDEEEPAAGHVVTLELFRIEGGTWLEIARSETAGDGRLQIDLDPAQLGIEGVAPALRLIEEGQPAPRVLSAGGMVRYDGRRRILFVDFGEIERLEESAYSRPAVEESFSGSPDAVAGVPRRAGLNQHIMLRNLDRNAVLRDAVSRNRVPLGGLVLNTTPAVEVAEAGSPRLRDEVVVKPAADIAAAIPREVDTLKGIMIEKDNLIVQKDQQLLSRTNELNLAKARNDELASRLSTEVERADIAEKKVATFEAQKRVTAPVTSVVAGLGTKLADANAEMKSKAVPFRLGAVKIDVRGRLSEDGSAIVMGDDVRDGSGFSAEMHADAQAERPTSGVTVPDVGGLTTAAAQRVLRSIGLKLAVAQQTLPAGSGTPGQALMQHPRAGESVAHGSDVLVVFGVASA